MQSPEGIREGEWNLGEYVMEAVCRSASAELLENENGKKRRKLRKADRGLP